jgi:hypothetical protein
MAGTTTVSVVVVGAGSGTLQDERALVKLLTREISSEGIERIELS